MFSYFTYAAAFTVETADGGPGIDLGLVAISLVIAPFVFVVLGFVSRDPGAARDVLRAMGLLVVTGLVVGLVSPALGASAGFGAGGIITLKRANDRRIVIWRISAVIFTVVYVLLLLVTITPAGLFAGGLLPLAMLGFADEYVLWARRRDGRPDSV